MNLLAQTYQEGGHYAEAGKEIEKALAIHRRIYAAIDPRIAEDYQVLGDIDTMRFRFAEAEDAYNKTIQIYDAWYGPEHPRSIESRITLGQALVYGGRLTSARRLLERGNCRGTADYGRKSPDYAACHDGDGNSGTERRESWGGKDLFRESHCRVAGNVGRGQ